MVRNTLACLLFFVCETYGYYTSTTVWKDTLSSTDDGSHNAWPECTAFVHYNGDGYCDLMNNIPECDYDGGDCCFCTCDSEAEYPCGSNGFNCTDPAGSDTTDCTRPDYYEDFGTYFSWENFDTFPNCTGLVPYIGDGQCDPSNNNPACGYDGGDCCFCTCTSTSYFECGVSGFDCVDPGGFTVAGCVPPEDYAAYSGDDYHVFYKENGELRASEYPNCDATQFSWIGDGLCNNMLNTPSCGYDGGDCCFCTCESSDVFTCGDVIFNCTDPDSLSRHDLCEAPVVDVPSCPPNLQSTWEISNPQQALLLAQVLNCSGGTFEVEWSGEVPVHEPFRVVGDTVLRVKGTDQSAVADGRGVSRIFIVVNATLHVADLGLVNGQGRLGGAISARRAVLSFQGTTFSSNSATYGGAIFASDGSKVSWSGNTVANNNTATLAGGALFITQGSRVSWSGRTSFTANTARNYGGAVHIRDTSNVSWVGQTIFADNNAGNGGGVSVWESEKVSFGGNVTFVGNSANRGDGGAVYIGIGCDVQIVGMANFTANRAHSDGGAIGSRAPESGSSGSNLFFDGTASFIRNSCEMNGGALALFALVATVDKAKLRFQENSAGANGGAVFMSDLVIGPRFEGAAFDSNFAGEDGGGVFAEASGTFRSDEKFGNSTSYSQCTFLKNKALGSGGAIHTAFGVDCVLQTSFIGNSADDGGAMKLAGREALVYACSFVENSATKPNGPAMSHLGSKLVLNRCDFRDNFFLCKDGEFVDELEVGQDKRFEMICLYCGECQLCNVAKSSHIPICTEAYEHTSSTGGAVTLQTLYIEAEYWRATEYSRKILPCYTPGACRGGKTGSSDYCDDMYMGPYCAVCKEGYASGVAHTCTSCTSTEGGLALIVVFVLIVGVITVIIVWHMVSSNDGAKGRRITERIARYIPIQSLKILVVVWQIVTQFASAVNVTYPHIYQRFLDGVSFINFELEWIFSAACEMDLDFHSRMLMITLGPFAILALLGVTYAIAIARNRHSRGALRRARDKHMSAVLWLTLLVYSSTSSVVFRMFACDILDDGSGYRAQYLRADYRIECDSDRHRALEIYTAFMVIVYPVGIPVFYTILLLRQREELLDVGTREYNPRLLPITPLWNPYKPHRFYYEVIECVRRMLLAGAVAFIYPNTAAQIAITLVVALAFAFLCEGLAPFESQLDAWISRAGHGIVFFSMYVALLTKVDVAEERDESQNVFAGVLVAAHVGMVAAILVEAIVLSTWARVRVDPVPRLRSLTSFKHDSSPDLMEPS